MIWKIYLVTKLLAFTKFQLILPYLGYSTVQNSTIMDQSVTFQKRVYTFLSLSLLHIRITILLPWYIINFFNSYLTHLIVHQFTTTFRISFSLPQYLPFLYFPYSAFLSFTLTTCLFSSSSYIIASRLLYF